MQLPYKPEDSAERVMWSEEDQAYRGHRAACASLAAHGVSPVLALRERTEVVGCVLDDVGASGEPVPPPWSQRPLSGPSPMHSRERRPRPRR